MRTPQDDSLSEAFGAEGRSRPSARRPAATCPDLSTGAERE